MRVSHKGALYRILSLALAITLLLPAAVWSFADEPRNEKIKVAYFQIGDYYQLDLNKNLVSYDAEYLAKVSAYTDLEFEFVDCGTWDNALNMLKAHEIDLMGAVQKTPERAEEFAFGDAYYGITYAALAATRESKYIFEDYGTIKNASIGCVKGYVNEKEMYALFKENGMTPNVVYFDSDTAMSSALESGEIDLAAANTYALHKDWRVIAKYAYSPYYFMSWRGNEALLGTIDEMILKLGFYNSGDDRLMEKYFSGLTSEPFTKRELDFISSKRRIPFFLIEGAAPVSWKNEDGEMDGILADICACMAGESGLSIAKLPFFDYYEGDRSNENTVRVSLTLQDELLSQPGDGTFLTNPVFSSAYSLYGKDTTSYLLGGQYKVAVPMSAQAITDYLKSYYPNCEIVMCDDSSKCFVALKRGQVDFVFTGYYVANEFLISSGSSGIASMPTAERNFSIRFLVKGPDALLLTNIINKSLSLVDEETRSDIVLEYALDMLPDASLHYFTSNRPELVFGIMLLIFALILIVAVLVNYAYMMKRQEALLAQSNQKLEKANAAKTDFLSRMSHDIRTPMNVIIGMTQLAMDEREAGEKDNCLKKIGFSSEFLLGLVNDILDMSKIESGEVKLHPEPYEIKEFISYIEAVIHPLCEAKNIEFKMDLLPEFAEVDLALWADKLRCNQIFFNLLSNAVKFTPEGGRVELFTENVERKDNCLAADYVVRDNGIGMSEDFMLHLFEPFSQESNEPGTNGSGLGLAIVKSLVDLMDGRISVESVPNSGSTFKVHLELPVTDKVDSEPLAKSANDDFSILRGRHVLLCEDHPLNMGIVERLLDKKGVILTTAENGKTGVEKFASSPEGYYDAVLMDIRMPVMDGLTAAREIRNLDRLDSRIVPIIAMTANAYSDDVKKSMAAGMNEHLTKPFDTRLFYKTLADCIMNK